MRNQKRYALRFKRKREGRTNYKKRLRLIISTKPRLVVRKFNKNITAQVITYAPDGDTTIATASSRQLVKLGWKHGRKNIPAAYLTGLLLGKKTAEKDVKKVILDSGFHPSVKGSKIYAVVEGLQDTGIDVPSSKEVLPSKERVSGKHIQEYASKNPEKHFTKDNVSTITQDFEALKKKIME